MRLPLSTLLMLVFVPDWSGLPRLPLLHDDVQVRARSFVPKDGWPRRIGALEPVGALRLSARDPAFGGFSALVLRNGAATLLSDGGNFATIVIRHGKIAMRAAGTVREGPGLGWSKESRDSESLAADPATGRLWIGYERSNAIWRYAPDLSHAEAWAAPAPMRSWSHNNGPESLVRLRDGRFIAIAEGAQRRSRCNNMLVVAGDPTRPGTTVTRLTYVPPAGHAVSDATQLPGGDLLVLNRRFVLPFRFSATLVRIDVSRLRAGAVVRGRVVATLGPRVLGENAEGIAVTREGSATMVWIVTDNDTSLFRPTILAKFRLIETTEHSTKRPAVARDGGPLDRCLK